MSKFRAGRPRAIAVANKKGGTMKTTTTVSVASILADQYGKKVLVIDLDPQASTSKWLGAPLKPGQADGVIAVFNNDAPLDSVAAKTVVDRVDCVSSSDLLYGIDKALAGEVGADRILANAIASVPDDRWDFVFIDCPPNVGLLLFNALAACDEVLIPIEMGTMALDGLLAFSEILETTQKRVNPKLRMLGILPCRVERTALAQEILSVLKQEYGDALMKTRIRKDVRITEAPSHGLPIHQYAPRCNAAKDYQAAAEEILRGREGNSDVE